MRPKPQNFYYVFFLQNLIHKTMLNIDTPRIRTREISNQFLIRRRILKRIFRDNVEQTFSLEPEIRGRYFFCVFLRLPGVNDNPTHQPGFLAALDSGSAMPLRMESRIPGIDTR